MRVQYFLGASIFFLFGACATQPKWPWKQPTDLCYSAAAPATSVAFSAANTAVSSAGNAFAKGTASAPSCTQEALALTMATTVAHYCEKYRAYYASGGAYSNNWQFAVSMSGALAGAVGAPLTSSVKAKNALAGYSGGVNAMQQQISKAYSTIDALNRANAVTAAYTQGANDFAAAGNDTKELEMIVAHTALMCATAGDASSQDNLFAAAHPAPAAASSSAPAAGSTSATPASAASIEKPAKPIKPSAPNTNLQNLLTPFRPKTGGS